MVAQLVNSGWLTEAVAEELVQGGRVDDRAWSRVRLAYEEQERDLQERRRREVEAEGPVTEDDVLRRVDDAVASVAALTEANEVYWAAGDVADAASEGLLISLPACHHYQIWSELTDRYELKPDEEQAAVAAMKRAADEWLAAKDHAETRTKYFERWLPYRLPRRRIRTALKRLSVLLRRRHRGA